MHGTVHFKRTYGVFVLVSVKPGVYNTTKQILEQRLQYIQDSNARTLKYPMYIVQTSAKNTWKIMANPCAVIIP